MTWLPDGRLQCDVHADQIFDHPGSRGAFIAAARIKGWIVFESETLSGKPIAVHACASKCARPALGESKLLPGDIPLWSDEDGL